MNIHRKNRIFIVLDFWIQSAMFVAVLGVVALMDTFSVALTILTMAIPIGIWQVMNGMIYLFAFKRINRRPYLIGSAACLFILYISAHLDNVLDSLVFFLMAFLAIWNYALTVRDYVD